MKKTSGDDPQDVFPWDKLPLELKVMIAEVCSIVLLGLMQTERDFYEYFCKETHHLKSIKNHFLKVDRMQGEGAQEIYRLPYGTYHREDGPAVISYWTSGKTRCEEYWHDGKWHREDGPALIRYCKDGKIYREYYWQDGKRHREDGPAVIWYDEDGKIEREEYWQDGKWSCCNPI